MTAPLPKFEWRPRRQRTVVERAGHWLSTFGGMYDLQADRPPPAGPLIPRTLDAKTPREDALGLLKLAAEVEHALMAQYLYAAWSIDTDIEGGADAAATFSHIAVQEMFHLLAVQNLLIVLGGPDHVHLGRDALRAASNFNPMPLVLEPADRAAVSKYVVAEMPLVIADAALRERLQKIHAAAKADANSKLNHVGAIYSALHWIFQADNRDMTAVGLGLKDGYEKGWHLLDTDFVVTQTVDSFAAQRVLWHASAGHTLEPVYDRAQALKLLHAIASQGEGLEAGTDSHFERFFALLEQDIPLRNGVPTSPYGSNAPAPDVNQKTPITSEAGRLWCDWFDVRYTMLWHDIGHALRTPASADVRRKLTNMVFAQMRSGLLAMARAAGSMPASDTAGGRAGPGFGMVFAALPEAVGARARALELAEMERQLAEQVRALPHALETMEAQDAYDLVMGAGGLHEQRNKIIGQTT